MVSSAAKSVPQYLASLPPDRAAAISALRALIQQALPPGYEECMQYGMLSWVVPFSVLPETYNGQPLGLISLASQKGNMALYLMSVYSDPAIEKWFKAEWRKTGKKLDMGKSCLRFKSLADLPLELIAQLVARVPVARYVARYHEIHPPKKPTAARKPAAAPARKK